PSAGGGGWEGVSLSGGSHERAIRQAQRPPPDLPQPRTPGGGEGSGSSPDRPRAGEAGRGCPSQGDRTNERSVRRNDPLPTSPSRGRLGEEKDPAPPPTVRGRGRLGGGVPLRGIARTSDPSVATTPSRPP